jgi:hypothetical protein
MTTFVERLLAHPNQINNKTREMFYAQRSWHPIVQMKFEAETVVEPIDRENGGTQGRILFPNGHVQHYGVEKDL